MKRKIASIIALVLALCTLMATGAMAASADTGVTVRVNGYIELLNSLTAEVNEQIRDARADADTAEKHYSELLESAENLRKEYDRLLTWADLYNKSTFEAKKMIAAQFIKAVRVGRDYNIEIDFNVSFEEFQSFCNAESADENLTPLRSHIA